MINLLQKRGALIFFPISIMFALTSCLGGGSKEPASGGTPIVSFNPSTWDVARLKTISSNSNPAAKVDPKSISGNGADSSGVGLNQVQFDATTSQITGYSSQGGTFSSTASSTLFGATTFAAKDFTSVGDYTKASSYINSGNSIGGNKYDQTDVAYLGGAKLGLQYTDFGVWQTYGTLVSGIPGASPVLQDQRGIYLGLNDLKTTPTNNSTFSGNAIGIAFDNSKNLQQVVQGSSTLTVDLTGKANLTLNFDNWYSFTVNNMTITNGAISDNRTTSITQTGSVASAPDKVSFSATSSAITAGFYGNNSDPTSKKEIAGAFDINNGASSYESKVGVSGGFGAKQQ